MAEDSLKHLSLDRTTAKRQRTETRLSGLSPLEPLLQRFPQLSSSPHATAAMGGGDESVDRTCPKCGDARHNNRVYCYTCCVPVGGLALPRVRIPLRLDIVKHPKELRGKSTALHAPVLCGEEQARCVDVPNVGQLGEFDPETTVLLFPSADSVTIPELKDRDKITRVVVVDSTWRQARSVLALPQLAGLRRVKLASNYQTSFWRYQYKGEDHLATIEAIYYFFKEWLAASGRSTGEEDNAQLDNLLYIFLGMLHVIEASKEEEGKLAAAAAAAVTTATETDNQG